jgi:hypothetical protein
MHMKGPSTVSVCDIQCRKFEGAAEHHILILFLSDYSRIREVGQNKLSDHRHIQI